MSVHNLPIEFSLSAQRDVDDILAYTLDNWGEDQLNAYKARMDTAFTIIV